MTILSFSNCSAQLRRCQAHIEAELAKGAKPDQAKIAARPSRPVEALPGMPRSIATQNRRAGGGDRPPEAAELAQDHQLHYVDLRKQARPIVA